MEWIVEPERKIPVVAEVDLLVCGGGVAGFTAAVCGARNGAKVLLIERYGFLGGLVTAALVLTIPPLNNGINIEIAERLKRLKAYAPLRNPGEDIRHHQLHAIDPEILKYEIIQMLKEQDVKLLLHTYITQSIVDDNKVKGVIIENKGGRQAVLAKVVVDATGDGDVSAFAGAKYEASNPPLPVTMMFTMVGVNTKRTLSKIGNWSNLRKFVEEGIRTGGLTFDLELYRKNKAPGVHAETLIYPNQLNVWSGSLEGVNALNPEDLTKAEIITREHSMRLANFLKKNLAGFKNARIECTSTQVGVRETRRIAGGISPSLEEVNAVKFNDAVAKPYAHDEMRVPFRSLLPQGVENLLVAGRCISVKQDALVKLRLVPACMGAGQAAGTAAALALKDGVTPRELNVSVLQETLIRQGVDLKL
jgi:ribulose 1,5-bisphosphate synthetase/thiazole synthase